MRLEPQPATPLSTCTSAAGVVGAPLSTNESPSRTFRHQQRRARLGLWIGALGVLVFALTIPMTRMACGSADAPQLSPVFVAIGRAGVAGLLSLVYLVATRAPWPRREHASMFALTIAGNVILWPLLLGLAVRHVDAMHAAVITGLMPLATAAVGAVMLKQRPSNGFWAFAVMGALLVVAFAAWRGAGRPQVGDLLLLGAVIASSLGYITGVRITAGPNGMTPEHTISWVLVLALPITLPVLFAQWPVAAVRASAWVGFGYVAVFSMWIGFFAWYRGLAWGGTLRVSQVQLLQPFVSILASVPLLGERLEAGTLGFSIAVMACVYLGRRMSTGAAGAVGRV